MTDAGLVSVVIPARNVESYVATAVSSVLKQTYRNLELIVVDDGSEDGTARAAEAAGDDRTRVVSGEQRGLAAARNRGMALATGRWLAFLDADDYWLPPKLEVQVEILQSRPDVVAVGCLARYVSSSGRDLGVAGIEVGGEQESLIAKGLLNPFPVSVTVFPRDPVVSVGGFDESLAVHIPGLVEDLDLLSRLSRHGRIACVPEILAAYRIHPASASARHYFSQRQGIRFIAAKRQAESQGDDLTWEEFARRRTSPWEWRQDIGAYHYRQAGMSIAEGRRVPAAVHGALAGLMAPLYTVGKLRRQLRHRVGDHPSGTGT